MADKVYLSDVTRKLASVQKISELRPIEGADRIEVAMMEGLGWECVTKKNELKVGDLVVYFEVDSILPEKPEYEFLRERKFRIKTIKLKKQVSQGLIVPLYLAIPGGSVFSIGADVTDLLGVKKHDPQGQEESDLTNNFEKKCKVPKFLMNMAWFRWIYFKLNPPLRKDWPQWIAKTDETRIQVCLRTIMDHYDEEWEFTEKLDGQSGTFFTYLKRKWGFKFKQYGVASRNIWLKKYDNTNYGIVSSKHNLDQTLLSEKQQITLQGEVCGPKIQKNKYKFEELNLFVFNIIVGGKKLNHNEMSVFCAKWQLTPVPFVIPSFIPSKDIGINKTPAEIIHHMVNMSKGFSVYGNKVKREGIVGRLKSNPNISLKIINPEFLLENDE